MIKRIELVNFMSHERTVIEPAQGLTVLIGPNNCGKSAIVNALQVLCTNPTSAYVLRHGAKECSITVETDSGDKIVWSRKKSGSPKYEINGTLFDRLNRKIPSQLHEILRLPSVQADKESYDVHFGEQRSPIFLLGDREKAAAQFFASSSDAIRLVEMQNVHKAKLRSNTHELERLRQESRTLNAAIETLTPIEKIRAQAQQCQRNYEDLQQRTALAKQLETDLGQLDEKTNNRHRLESSSKVLARLTDPPKIAHTAIIESTLARLEHLHRVKSSVDKSVEVFDQLPHPPAIANTLLLGSIIDRLESRKDTLLACEQKFSVLQRLKQPPVHNDVDSIKTTIASLSSKVASKNRLAKQSKLLDLAPSPPPLQSPLMLAEAIDALETVQRSDAQLTQLLAATENDLTTAQRQLQDWIQANPQCPTCGAEISIDTLDCTAPPK